MKINRYEKVYDNGSEVVLDTERGGLLAVLSADEITARLNEYEALLFEADEYLSINKLTNIGSGSILHKKFIEITGDH